MKSIRTKLWIGMMIFVGMIILLLWLFQIVFLEKFYSTLEIKEVMKNADYITQKIEKLEHFNEIDDSTEIVGLLEKFSYNKQLALQIMDESKIIHYQISSGENMSMPGMIKDSINEVIHSALLGKKSKVEVTHPKFGNKFMIMAIPILGNNTNDTNNTSKGTVEGVMLITLPMASVEDTAEILKDQLIIITIVLFLVSILISFTLSKIFTKPILHISKLAEKFSLGEFDARLKKIGKDEIGQLAKRMNHMGEELARNELLQKELISNVSHELRTPLTLIRGYAETLRDITGSIPEKRDKQLGVIIEESERLSKIVEDILSLSQLQAGAINFEREVFSLIELLQDIRDRYELQDPPRTFIINGDLKVEGNIYGDHIDKDQIYGDKRRIEQVFYNLLNNAFRHTGQDDVVEITLTKENDIVKVQVRDHGDGIAEEDLSHIFERYYKGKSRDGNKKMGTGLGLAIVKSILEMHEVNFGVESQVGVGTTFWFELMQK